jgi:hypothetical protein
MGWRSTIVLTVLVIVVGAYLRFADAPATPATRPGSAANKPPGADAVQALQKLLVFEPRDVVDLQLQRAGRTHRLHRENGTWQGIEDPSAVDDFLHSLSQMRVLMDISASAQELADYGLAPPLGVIALHVGGQAQPLVLQIGERNPATTGVYVRIGDDGAVVLAGALVEWEFDNLFRRLNAAG